MKNFDWYGEQGIRFQEYLNQCEKELDDFQLQEALDDLFVYEAEEGKMTFDTFKERLEIRLS